MIKITKAKLKRTFQNPKLFLNFFSRKFGGSYYFPVLREIILYANTICNARCLFCDIGQENRAKSQGEKDKKRGIAILADSKDKFFSLRLLHKILQDDYVQKNRPCFNILMTEPLLSENIFEIVSSIKRKNYKVNITTNGILLPEKAEGLILAGLDSIQISLSGPKTLHNKLSGGDFFEKAIQGIKILNSASVLPITINCTISNLNYDRIESFIEEIDLLGLKIHRLKLQFLNFVSEQMRERQNNNFKIKQTISTISKIIDPEEVDSIVLAEQIEKVKKKRYLNIGKIDIIPDLRSAEEISKFFSKQGVPLKGYNKCYVPFVQIAVKPNGETLFHMRCYNYKIGNIRQQGVREVFLSKSAQYFRQEFLKSNLCFPACTRCCGVLQ